MIKWIVFVKLGFYKCFYVFKDIVFNDFFVCFFKGIYCVVDLYIILYF